MNTSRLRITLFTFSLFSLLTFTLHGLLPEGTVGHFSWQEPGFMEEEEEAHGDFSLRDRIDLAMKQEFERTKDPATNTVPRERLLVAQDTLEVRQKRNSSRLRTEGSITGINWTERGPNNWAGRTRCIIVDQNDATKKTVWTGSVGGGLWKTTDITVASPAWVPVDDFFSNLSITGIAQNPLNPQEMYFSTGEGYFNADYIRGLGVFKSTNGGATWSQLASTTGLNFRYIYRIAVNASGVLFVATYYNGLYRSTDGGNSFTKVLGTGLGITGAASNRCFDVEFAPNGDVYGALNGSIHKSTNGGVTFGAAMTLPITGDRIELATASSDANYVYAVLETVGASTVNGIIRTTDGGATWSLRSEPDDADTGIPATDFSRGQAWYDLEITVDPNNRDVVYVGGVDLFKSTDGANSWGQIAHWYGGFGYQDVHADQHVIYFEPGNSSVIYFGNDGGIYRSANGTAAIPTISYRGSGYRSIQFYGCAMHPSFGSNVFLAGAQDNGSHRFSAAGLGATVEVTGGDGAFCHIDQDQPTYMWTQYVYNNYRRSTNGGTSFTNVNFNNNGQFINPSDYDNTANHMYAAESGGYYTYWSNPQTGSTFTAVAVAAFNGAEVTSVTCSEATQDLVFFGLDNADVVKVANANTATPTATNISTGLPGSGAVSCVALESGNENHMLVTYSNYGVNSVWESSNGGTTWTSVEGNLPDMPVRYAMFNPNNAAQALIATELGVWSTDLLNGGSTNWAPSNTGLANVRTDMLQWRASDKLIIASTHGRGLFSTTILDPTPVTWLSFNARQNKQNVLLQWITGSESNNAGFDIERSADGKAFSTIGHVLPGQQGNGVQGYSFTDSQVNEGSRYYYRIRQTDKDGHTDFTNILLVVMNSNGLSFDFDEVFPNPFSDALQVSFVYDDGSPVHLELRNTESKVVYRTTLTNTNGAHRIPTTALPAGTYFLSAEQKGLSSTRKVLKVK